MIGVEFIFRLIGMIVCAIAGVYIGRSLGALGAKVVTVFPRTNAPASFNLVTLFASGPRNSSTGKRLNARVSNPSTFRMSLTPI